MLADQELARAKIALDELTFTKEEHIYNVDGYVEGEKEIGYENEIDGKIYTIQAVMIWYSLYSHNLSLLSRHVPKLHLFKDRYIQIFMKHSNDMLSIVYMTNIYKFHHNLMYRFPNSIGKCDFVKKS